MAATPNIALTKALGTEVLDYEIHLNPNWDTIETELSASGTTATRPTTKLYIGKRYFDTDLGKPVFLKQVSPAIWVDGIGTVV